MPTLSHLGFNCFGLVCSFRDFFGVFHRYSHVFGRNRARLTPTKYATLLPSQSLVLSRRRCSKAIVAGISTCTFWMHLLELCRRQESEFEPRRAPGGCRRCDSHWASTQEIPYCGEESRSGGRLWKSNKTQSWRPSFGKQYETREPERISSRPWATSH